MNIKALVAIVTLILVFGGSYFVSQNNSAGPSTSNQTNKPEKSGSSIGKTLDLSGQQLTELSDEILNQTDIVVLNLSNNQLTTLPAGIAMLVNLQVLNVENNRLVTLPAQISELKNLRQILANNNRMENVPGGLYTMTWLQLLDISGNNIPSNQLAELKAKLPNTQVK